MTHYIVYASDDKYAEQLGVSLSSLLENNRNLPLCVYVLDNGISEQKRTWLKEIAKSWNSVLSFVDISNIESLLPTKVEVNSLSLSTYARLFLPDLLPTSVENVLYIDCDTFICSSLEELFNIDIDKYAVAGVEDTMYPSYKEGVGMKTTDQYINAGILLINLRMWREQHLKEIFMDFIMRCGGKVPHLDQGVINGTIGERMILPLKYNVQTPIYSFKRYMDLLDYFSMDSFYAEKEVVAARQSPVIIHYTSFFLQRPWFDFCLHPKRMLYRNELYKLKPAVILQKSHLSIIGKIKCWMFYRLQYLYLNLRKI